MKIIRAVLSEYKIIVKSKIFMIFVILTALFILIDSFYLYAYVIPETIDNRIKLYSESLLSISDWVVIDKEFIMDLVRPIHPYTSFLNPIYMFSTISIVVFIIISSILMGNEFKNKTIKVKMLNYSKLHIFLTKILTVVFIYISYIIYTIIINIVVSSVFWNKIKSEYSFFLNKFNLDFSFYLYEGIKDMFIFVIASSLIIMFYSVLSICLVYWSSLTTFGIGVCVLPFIKFNSMFSKLIVMPMDIYYHVLRNNISIHKQGSYAIPEGNLLSSMTSLQLLLACTILFLLEAILLLFANSVKKHV
ncbi:MAG TPA: hypothetical protein PK604_09915 [Acetivibrio clariflavus]|nr:hypothetical protein [Acetivibrio clariflavus]